jgi:hypothetical protein
MLLAHDEVKEGNLVYQLLEEMLEVNQASLEGA